MNLNEIGRYMQWGSLFFERPDLIAELGKVQKNQALTRRLVEELSSYVLWDEIPPKGVNLEFLASHPHRFSWGHVLKEKQLDTMFLRNHLMSIERYWGEISAYQISIMKDPYFLEEFRDRIDFDLLAKKQVIEESDVVKLSKYLKRELVKKYQKHLPPHLLALFHL